LLRWIFGLRVDEYCHGDHCRSGGFVFPPGVRYVCLAGADLFKRKRSGLSPQEFVRAGQQASAEQVQQAVEEWSVPPGLDAPTPRPLRTGNLILAWMPAAPLLFIVVVLAVITWNTKLYVWPSVILLAIGCVIRFFRHRNEKKLLVYGEPARALITHSNKSVHHLEYHDAAGALIKGQLARNRVHNKVVLTVLYDLQRPRQFISYPVTRYKIAVPGTL
jgi:hypothetical protein